MNIYAHVSLRLSVTDSDGHELATLLHEDIRKRVISVCDSWSIRRFIAWEADVLMLLLCDEQPTVSRVQAPRLT